MSITILRFGDSEITYERISPLNMSSTGDKYILELPMLIWVTSVATFCNGLSAVKSLSITFGAVLPTSQNHM